MLGKLIKYEFRASGRLIPLVYVVVLLLGIAGAVLSFFELYVFTAMSFILMMLAGAAAFIITYVIIFLRFYRGMFGAEGYLAMTLPVTPLQLYISKSIVAFVWLLMSSIVTIVSWTAAFGSLMGMGMRAMAREFDYSMTEFWQEFREALAEIPAEAAEAMRGFFHPAIILLFLFIVVVGYLAFTSQVFFCVTISNVKPFASMGVAAAILAYVVIAIFNSIVSTVLSYVIPLSLVYDYYTGWHLTFQSQWSYLFGDNYYSYSTTPMGIGSYILPILYAFVLPFFTIKLIESKVNLK